MNIQYLFQVTLVACMILISSCTQEKALEIQNNDGKLVINASVDHPMGTTLDANNYNFMPLPYNLGSISNEDKKLPVIILGPASPKNSSIDIQVLGALKVKEKGAIKYYLLGQSIQDNQTLELESFEQFAVQYSSIKSIIGLYLNNQYGLGQSEIIEWRDEAIAMKLIEKLTKSRSQDKTNN